MTDAFHFNKNTSSRKCKTRNKERKSGDLSVQLVAVNENEVRKRENCQSRPDETWIGQEVELESP